MTEYISRDAAIKAVCEGCNAEYGEEPCEPSDCNIMQILRSIPAADVRPVVLCRDCVHARRYTNKIKCGYWSGQTDSEIVCEDDFCSYGRKREES